MMDVIKKTLVFLALFLSRKKICKCQLRKIQVASFLISLSFFNCVIFFFYSAHALRARPVTERARSAHAFVYLSSNGRVHF